MNKTYCCSDLHGCLTLYNKICERLDPSDKVYFLGDAGDRGPQSWETVKAIASNPQWIYLCGNHEDMLVNAASEKLNLEYFDDDVVELLYYNGGYETLDGLLTSLYPEAWTERLGLLPNYEEYINAKGQVMCLSHAGFSPSNQTPGMHDLIWDRSHFHDQWTGADNQFIIHGHTPTLYLAQELGVKCPEGALRYADGHKIDIDCGSFATHKTVLLDLDTLEEIIIQEEG